MHTSTKVHQTDELEKHVPDALTFMKAANTSNSSAKSKKNKKVKKLWKEEKKQQKELRKTFIRNATRYVIDEMIVPELALMELKGQESTCVMFSGYPDGILQRVAKFLNNEGYTASLIEHYGKNNTQRLDIRTSKAADIATVLPGRTFPAGYRTDGSELQILDSN